MWKCQPDTLKTGTRDVRAKSTSKYLVQAGFAISLVAVGVLVHAEATAVAETKRPAQWNAKAVYLWPGPTDIADAPDGPRIATVQSRDQRFTLQIKENDLLVRVQSGEAVARPIKIEDLAEVSWSPDSKEFAVTESDGGWVGSWTTIVYAVDLKGMRKYDVSHQIEDRFQARKGGCDETPNVAAAGWLAPDLLLMVAEAPPHSSCKDMGTLRGYELTVHDGKIQHEYDASELFAKFANQLGPRVNGPS